MELLSSVALGFQEFMNLAPPLVLALIYLATHDLLTG